MFYYKIYDITPIDQTSTSLPYGFCAKTLYNIDFSLNFDFNNILNLKKNILLWRNITRSTTSCH